MSASDDGTIRQVLDYLGGDLDPSILIGGWATHFRIRGEISHDIDLIVTDKSRHRVQGAVTDLSTTRQADGGSTQRGDVEGIHVDIYTPHESKLGARLLLRVEVLSNYAEPLPGSRWLLLTIEAHILTKMAAILDRHASAKGEKDARELLGLLRTYDADIEPEAAAKVLIEAADAPTSALPEMIAEAFGHIGKLNPPDKADRRFLETTGKRWVSAVRMRINASAPRPPL